MLRPGYSIELCGCCGHATTAIELKPMSSPARQPRVRPANLRLPLLTHIGLFLALAVIVAILAGLLVWVSLGRPDLIGGPTRALDVKDRFDVVKLILAVAGGIGAVVALTIAYRRQRHSEAAEYREDTKLYTDRFGRAAEQLGHDKAAVRLAGTYALAELADDWDDGRQVCIDVLCAYLRMPYTPPTAPDPAAMSPDDFKEAQQVALLAWQERQVRHTVIRLIGDHLRPSAAVSWQGHDFDFTGALFDGGDFGGLHISGGSVSFSEATFSGGNVNFNGATFSGGNVNFNGATFSGGNVNFDHATFSDNGGVSFNGATFSGGNVNFSLAKFSPFYVVFSHATFSGGNVNFNAATFSGGGVVFSDATFSGGNVSFSYATFSGGEVNFIRAAFSGGNVNFNGAMFAGGTVDLSHPRNYSTPPAFDAWPAGPPPGLVLPASGP
jgi:uncharacterized protein YjbI with pentapeptide repeats